MCSVYAGKTSTPRTAGRVKGRRNVNSSTPVVRPAVARQQKNVAHTTDETPLSPVSTHSPQPTADRTPNSLQRTYSSQSSASAASSVSGGGGGPSSKAVPAGSVPKPVEPVPKPRSMPGIIQPDVVDAAPSRRPGRDPRRRVLAAPSGPADKPAGGRSQSSPGDHRVKTTPTQPAVVPAGVRSVTPRTHHQQVDRSLGSVDSPALSAFVDRSGLVFDVRSKSAYRRGRLLGKVRGSPVSSCLTKHPRHYRS